MITFHRIQGFLLRHWYEILASMDRKVDIFFWPTIDLLTFGLLTVYIDKLQVETGVATAILGLDISLQHSKRHYCFSA